MVLMGPHWWFFTGTLVEGELPLKRSLAQRLGGKVGSSDEDLDVDQPSQQGEKLYGQMGLSNGF